MKNEIIFTIVITILLTFGTALATQQVNIRYDSNNTITAYGNGFDANKSFTIKYYADGVIGKTVDVTADTSGNWQNTIPITDLPSAVTSYYVCEYSTGYCSQNIFSKYILSIPDEMKTLRAQMDNKTDMMNQIIYEFNNQTNVTALRNDWNTFKAGVLLDIAHWNDTINSLNDTLNSINSNMQKINQTIPTGTNDALSVLSSRIDTAIASSQKDNIDLENRVDGKIASIQMMSFITLIILIISLLATFFVGKRKKKKDDKEAETTEKPPVIILGADIKQETLDKLKEIMSKPTGEEKENLIKKFKKEDPEAWEKYARAVY